MGVTGGRLAASPCAERVLYVGIKHVTEAADIEQMQCAARARPGREQCSAVIDLHVPPCSRAGATAARQTCASLGAAQYLAWCAIATALPPVVGVIRQGDNPALRIPVYSRAPASRDNVDITNQA